MIKQRKLGQTGISVSAMGLGTVKFGRNQKINYPQNFNLPSDKEILEILSCAKNLGINLLDTAPAYGNSEERLGKLINRHDWIISTKVGEEFIDGVSYYDFSPQAIKKSIERSLKRLNTDYLDIVLVHSNGEDQKIIEESAVFSTLAACKKAGLIRAFGMSTKTVSGGKQTVDHADVVMVTYNPVQTEEQSVITYAQQKNKGVFIKKAFASGHLQKISAADPVLAALQFIFKESGVSSVIMGTLNLDHLKHNVECAENVLSQMENA